jgi:3',5'-cyclic-AMP phosphodiesterase
MPFELPPLSRRRFLASSLLAGLAVGFRLPVSGTESAPDYWAFFSDTHIAADRSKVERKVNMTQNFTGVLRDMLSLPARPVGVFITGDCACSSGQSDDYGVFKELVAPARKEGIPIRIALGNHDHRERFWKAFDSESALPRPVPDHHVGMIATPKANWIMLDSLEITHSTPGLLGKEQLAWLEKTLDANPDKPALVMAHHNPGLGKNEGLRDTDAFLEILRSRKQVKAYFFGHTHSWQIHTDSVGLHFVNLPATAYTFKDSDAKGWVRVMLQDKGMQLELRCLDTSNKANGQMTDLKWR